MNVFQYAANEEVLFENMLNEVGNYKRKTTFYSDLSIAEFVSGIKGIRDTFKNVCKSWINNVEYFTEFVMCLNYKSWEWNGKGDETKGQVYSDLYYEAQDLFYKHYEGNKKALNYYFEVTD